jgi:glycosyltransferase involved in cell wall biosynthesis
MRLCLALAFQDEAPWLRLHLPVFAGAADGLVGLDGGSVDDSADVFRAFGGVVHQRAFDWNFGAHMNALMAACEAEGYDALLRLDPDEVIYPALVENVRDWLATYDAVAVPRYGFIGDRLHHNPRWHPDYQVRGLRLGVGLRYGGLVHEQINYRENGYRLAYVANDPLLHLYHYGWILPLEARREREGKYAALVGGNPDPAAHLAEGYPYHERYTGPQPLDPVTIGARAPLE